MSVWAPTKVISDGLVFYYDTGNDKSYAGPPTTNLVNPSWTNWTLDSSGYSTGGTRTITSNNPYECTIVDISSNTRQWIYITGISASTTYTFSVLYKKIAGTPTLRFQIQAYNNDTYVSLMSFATTVDLGITDIYGWQKAKITLTTPAGCNKILWFMQDGDDYTGYTHSFMLANPQCEQKSYATPFTPSSRSVTQGLLDLTGQKNININSTTFDSNANIDFTGSGIVSGGNIGSSFTNFTINCWFYSTSVVNYRNVFDLNYGTYSPNTGNVGPRLEQMSTGVIVAVWSGNTSNNGIYNYSNQFSIAASTYYNFTWTCASGTMKFYLNGNPLQSTTSAQGYVTSFADAIIGNGFALDATRYFIGRIPIFAVYNTTLSDTQVLQNFNATKGRFGL